MASYLSVGLDMSKTCLIAKRRGAIAPRRFKDSTGSDGTLEIVKLGFQFFQLGIDSCILRGCNGFICRG